MSEKVNEFSSIDVERITVNLVKRALKKMKDGKNDSLFNLQSDCFTNGPDILIQHLVNLLQMYVTHGFVPNFILTCTLLPIVKDNLADITSSSNYRAIAGGSLLVKLLDIVILLLEGDKLQCDQLQFGFQAESSTIMCSWTATTVIEHYNRNGSVVYGCAMDLSKAFDMVEWVSLFRILIDKEVSPAFLRILMYVYTHQMCVVKWNSKFSLGFSVKNGVRQGAVSSPILFSIYIDELIKKLRMSGLGCRFDGHYYGVVVYADDLLLLSASRSGLQGMVSICEKFALSRNLKFSTDIDPLKSKTKCILFSKSMNLKNNVAPIILNGNALPWVDEVKHLGNILESNNSMTKDCLIKRGRYIGKVNSLLQELYFVQPSVLLKLISIYCTSFYGSSLWNLYSASVNRIFSAWNVTVRNVFSLPRNAHRYIVESISDICHPKVLLCSRYMKFIESLQTCKKSCVRYLALLVKDDRRTVTGRTISAIARDCGTKRVSLSSKDVKKMKYIEVPTGEVWRNPFLQELLDVRAGCSIIPGVEMDELEELIKFVSSS